MTEQEQQSFIEQVAAMADAHRARCLWFVRDDFRPQTMASARRALAYLERYGDQHLFSEVRRLQEWLSRHSNASSAR